MEKSKLLNDCYKQICDSEDFKKSPLYSELLKYLIDASIQEKSLKEYTIATEFFKKETEKANVRVYVYQLRKKLDNFYKETDKDYKYKISLEKGNYNIHIDTHEVNKDVVNLHYIYLTIIGLLLGVFIAVLLIEKKSVSEFDKSLVWGAFSNKNSKVTVVLGDYYFFEQPINKEDYAMIRYPGVNSNEDLDSIYDKLPKNELGYRKSDFKYINPATGQLTYTLYKVLHTNSGVNFKLASDYSSVENNTIFMGTYNTLYHWKGDVFKLGITKTKTHLIYKQTSKTLSFKMEKDVDYVCMVKTFVNNKEVLYILFQHPYGVTTFIDKFTNINYLEDFENKLLKTKSKKFKAIFKIYGIRSGDLNMDLVSLDSVL